MPLHLAIAGASGKMGSRIIELAQSEDDLLIKGGSGKHSPLIGKALHGVPLHTSLDPLIAEVDVVIDFSTAQALTSHLEACLTHKKALVIGTTGHEEKEKLAIAHAAQSIPILFSPNFSLGVALTLHATSQFAKGLKGLIRVDIVETHHTQKKDSPSGTALALESRIRDADNCAPENIVIHSIRSGNVVGEHRVIFECEHERIELRHEALSRDCFAKGALLAARFLAPKGPGLYSLQELFLS